MVNSSIKEGELLEERHYIQELPNIGSTMRLSRRTNFETSHIDEQRLQLTPLSSNIFYTEKNEMGE